MRVTGTAVNIRSTFALQFGFEKGTQGVFRVRSCGSGRLRLFSRISRRLKKDAPWPS